MSSDLLLTPKERERLAKVRAMLRAGQNPYESMKADDQGGLGKDRKARSVSLGVEQSEARIKELENKWRSGEEGIANLPSYPHDSPLWAELGIVNEAPVALGPDEIVCSYCSKRVSRIRATHGTGPTRKIVKTEIVEVDDTPTIVEKVKYFAEKVIACPGCALNIKPTVTRDKATGKVTSVKNNVKFPIGD